jgi:hypothetical protein
VTKIHCKNIITFTGSVRKTLAKVMPLKLCPV